ncbi:putative oxidoreductase ORF5 in fasciation locus [Enhygromyxa salina]|uniref:Putative oxidoreductase ORF5 in fasciation locus n=1 Tax=Enhygromyxa salina TaxID=215803 RepID=A0A2S9YJI9_9BACT|nr:FAD-binding protein [Enhygromyxa salina]PRQ05277.1 putative oxidoreductase ORF5 in fasciation locus [Enhygromyxa salina]
MTDSLENFPVLQGDWTRSESVLQAAASDYGRIVNHRPLAVIRPRVTHDIQLAIQFARRQKISVAARGRGHSTFGQAQAHGGLILDMSSFCEIRECDEDSAWLGGGCSWAQVVDHFCPRGRGPAVLTDYLGLSVAGTLSVGGVGGASFRHGAQTDNVLELEVVTGAGDFVSCSPDRNADLFDAVRAGLGQCGVIVAARMRLVPTGHCVRVHEFVYPDFHQFIEAARGCAKVATVDYVDGTIVATGDGRHTFVLTAAEFERSPGQDVLGQAGAPVSHSTVSKPYGEFVRRVDHYVERLKQRGLWDVPHPWLDLFVPAQGLSRFMEEALRELRSEDDGMILIYMLDPSKSNTPLLAFSEGEEHVLVDLLRNTPQVGELERQLGRNDQLTELGAELGASIYPIGSMPNANWDKLYRGRGQLADAKRRFDPDHILTPGQGARGAGVGHGVGAAGTS